MKSVNQNIIEKFNDLLGEEKVKVDEPMKRHTTFPLAVGQITFCFRLLRKN